MFAGVFFFFKYNVDKYNLSFVYNSEFRGSGQIFKRVMPLCIINIVLFQVILVGFFAINQKRTHMVLYSGLLLIGAEVVVIVGGYYRYERAKRVKHLTNRERAKMLRAQYEASKS